ncbi:MAG: TPM domain-containing protein [Clostridia bacterium]|nr:TPM domain-containing protein [Clostridia bacterium]
MKKTINKSVAFILCLLMLIGFTPVASAEDELPNVIDQVQLFNDEAWMALDELLYTLSAQLGYEIIAVVPYMVSPAEEKSFVDTLYYQNGYGFDENRNGVVLVANDNEMTFKVYPMGYNNQVFTASGIQFLEYVIAPFLDTSIADMIALFAMLTADYVLQAKTGTPYKDDFLPNAADYFDRLIIGWNSGVSDDDILRLKHALLEMQERDQFDAMAIYFPSFASITLAKTLEEFYKTYGFGVGESKDGIILYYSEWPEETELYVHGYGKIAFTESGQAYILKTLLPILKNREYLRATETYMALCRQFLAQARSGDPYDGDFMPGNENPSHFKSGAAYSLGDVNGDGKVNSSDARQVLRCAAKLVDFSETQRRLADINGDGKVNSIDARKVLRIAARLEPLPDEKITVA